jgi:hypothetical protein
MLQCKERSARRPVELVASRCEVFQVIIFSILTLLTEASRVIELRLRMMAQGKTSSEEMLLMVTEKIEAMGHAGQTVLQGGDPALVVDYYRKIVAANVERLTKLQPRA